jgi:hypothetical protein
MHKGRACLSARFSTNTAGWISIKFGIAEFTIKVAGRNSLQFLPVKHSTNHVWNSDLILSISSQNIHHTLFYTEKGSHVGLLSFNIYKFYLKNLPSGKYLTPHKEQRSCESIISNKSNLGSFVLLPEFQLVSYPHGTAHPQGG